MSLVDFLKVPLFQKALSGAFLSGIGLSLLGVIIVNLNLITVRFTLMHTALLGAALGMALGWSPFTGALVGIVIASFLLGPASDYIKIDTGFTGMVFMTGSLGLTFLVFYKAGIPALEAWTLFSGNLLALENIDLWVIGILSCLVVLIYFLFYREIQMVLYNPDLAESLGVPVKLIRNGLLFFSGLAIGVSIKTVGALLIDAAILLPSLAAVTLGRSLKGIFFWSVFFGVSSQIGGLVLSMLFDLPSGATITLMAVLLLCLSAIFSRLKRISERDVRL